MVSETPKNPATPAEQSAEKQNMNPEGRWTRAAQKETRKTNDELEEESSTQRMKQQMERFPIKDNHKKLKSRPSVKKKKQEKNQEPEASPIRDSPQETSTLVLTTL